MTEDKRLQDLILKPENQQLVKFSMEYVLNQLSFSLHHRLIMYSHSSYPSTYKYEELLEYYNILDDEFLEIILTAEDEFSTYLSEINIREINCKILIPYLYSYQEYLLKSILKFPKNEFVSNLIKPYGNPLNGKKNSKQYSANISSIVELFKKEKFQELKISDQNKIIIMQIIQVMYGASSNDIPEVDSKLSGDRNDVLHANVVPREWDELYYHQLLENIAVLIIIRDNYANQS